MRNPTGAYTTRVDTAGATAYLHHRAGQAPPTPIRRPPRDPIDPIACAQLYSLIAARYRDTPLSSAAVAVFERRYGPWAAAAQTRADCFTIPDPGELERWLGELGRTRDAKNAGILEQGTGALSPALTGRLVYAFRQGETIYDLRGRALAPDDTPKVRSLAGGREERGAGGVWYQHDQLAAAGGHIRVAGGCEKADALIVAGLPAVGTNEGQASQPMIAALGEAGIIVATIHVDAEDAKEGRPLSEGRRLALALAERLETAGIAVRVAEPERAAGAPKLDADTLLRDAGPEALARCDRQAVPLSIFRQRIGARPAEPASGDTTRGTCGQLVEDLRQSLHRARQDREAERRQKEEAIALNRAILGALAHPELKSMAATYTGLVLEEEWRRTQGKVNTIPDPDGRMFVQYWREDVGKRVGQSDDTVSTNVKRLKRLGLVDAFTKTVITEVLDDEGHPTGELTYDRQTYQHIDGANATAKLERLRDFHPRDEDLYEAKDQKGKHGGKRRCSEHPDAVIRYTTTATCTVCGKEVDEATVEYRDGEGNTVDAPPDEAVFPVVTSEPQDAVLLPGADPEGTAPEEGGGKTERCGYLTTYTGGGGRARPLKPQDAVLPPPLVDPSPARASVVPDPPVSVPSPLAAQRPYCFNRGGSVRCMNRVDPDRKYCPSCQADGWGSP